MGGSDQWGNIVTGTELIRRKEGGEAFALTCPLITKADGAKFGKTERGNVWLDPEKTSPYHFYQFWINTSDEDAMRYIRIFSLLSKEEIESISERHSEAPHLRLLQKQLAHELTTRIHGEAECSIAIEASYILFGSGTTDTLKSLPENVFLSVFDGVPLSEVSQADIEQGIPLLEFLADRTGIFGSRGEARRMVKDNGVSINKAKAAEEMEIGKEHLINNRYILVQKGKKNYYLVRCN
jgi:tyrosyl-tRNA synthetase